MKVDTFFSGIGGFDLAFEQAGFTVNSMCEIDQHAQGILLRHFPDAKLYDDIRKVGSETHGKTGGIVCGGFPCQDLSIAGKRAGLVGERSGLWYEFARVIDELEPGWVVIENVPGLLSSNKGRDFAVILRWLVERGYGVSWRVLDAQYFGVAQRRRRVFIVGSLGSGRSAEVLFESESGAGDTPKGREAGKEVAYSLRANPSHSGDKGDGGINTTMIAEPLFFDAAQITSKQHGSLPSTVSQPLNTLGQMSVFARQRSDEYKEGDIVETISQRDYKSASDLISYNVTFCDTNGTRKDRPNGGLYVNETEHANTLATNGNNELMIAWQMNHASEVYRESSGDTVPTLQARMGTGGNNVPLVGVRRLTPTECERLQGFPDGWTDGQSDSQRYKQLGNAVAVPVVRWIAERIKACELRP